MYMTFGNSAKFPRIMVIAHQLLEYRDKLQGVTSTVSLMKESLFQAFDNIDNPHYNLFFTLTYILH